MSVGLIVYVLQKVDLGDSLSRVREASLLLLLLGTVSLVLQPVLGALRWKPVLSMLGSVLPFGESLRIVWIGTFFSQALPGSIGGDLVRIWLLWCRGIGVRYSVISVALERAAMLVTLVVLVALAQPMISSSVGPPAVGWIVPALLVSAVATVAALLLSKRPLEKFVHLRAIRAIGYLAVATRQMLLRPWISLAVVAASVAAYANLVVCAWLIALALGIDATLYHFAVIMPIVILASTLPISIAGWGVRESVMIVLLGSAGIPSAEALALSVLFGLAAIVISLPGAALWLIGGHRVAELDDVERLAERESLTS